MATAAPNIFETFESPTYTNGQILASGSASETTLPWFVAPGFLDGKLKITNERSNGGSQSLKYESFDAMPPSLASLDAGASLNPVLRYSVDFYRPSTSSAGGAQLDAHNMSGGTYGSLRFFNGNLLAMDDLGFYQSVGTFASDTWTTLSIEVINVNPTTVVTRYFKDGSQLGLVRTAGGWTGTTRAAMSFQSGGGANPTVAYADNLRLTTAAVPEPATMAAMGLGLAAFARRRSRQQKS